MVSINLLPLQYIPRNMLVVLQSDLTEDLVRIYYTCYFFYGLVSLSYDNKNGSCRSLIIQHKSHERDLLIFSLVTYLIQNSH